jgi:D-amino-acid dehydrogenase
MDRALWRWVKLWLAECELERFRVNKARMQRIALYSREVLRQLREHYQLDYEQTTGFLQLFRTEEELELAQPALALLAEHEVQHQLIDAEKAREIEPALSAKTTLAGGLFLPDDESGNCALFTKQLRTIAQDRGVEFHFGSTVSSIEPQGGRVGFRIDDRHFDADAVVVAAGIDSARLLAPLGIRVPLHPVKGYAANVAIRNFDEAPRAAVMDETYKIAVTRMGNRIRLAGLAELGSQSFDLHETALRTLVKVGDDWFPDAANYNAANFWCGIRPTLPDGPPLLGATPIRNLYLNIGHGSTGWAMAAGCGRVLADIISGRVPDIDMEGLTLARYQ